jgi:hypothetical protein
MAPASIALLLSLAGPTAPAAKTDKGLPNDVIDVIPEDTAGVLVIEPPKVVKTESGQAILKLFDAQQRPNQPLHFADLGPEAEWIVLAQFRIDQAVGDFALIVRLKADSGYGKALIDKVKADNAPSERIGSRTVYSLFRPGFGMAMVDDRTLMVVLATSDTPGEMKATLGAAFGDRENPGPSRELRKLIADGAKDDRPIQMYGHHPKKLALSASLPLASFGVRRQAVADLGDKLVSYRGGIRMGEAGDVELRFTATNAEAAREALKASEAVDGDLPPFVKEFRAGTKVVREGAEVILTARLTKAILELAGPKRNK